MTDEMKKAFDFAADLTKQLITLATGIIGLTITFIKDFVKNSPQSAHPYAYAAWFCFLASIALGILTLSALTGSLGRSSATSPANIYTANITMTSVLQFFLFAAGLTLTILFAIKSV